MHLTTGVFGENATEFQTARVAGTEAQQRRDRGRQQTVAAPTAIDGHRRELHAHQSVRETELATDLVRGPRLPAAGPEDAKGLVVAGLGTLRAAQGLESQREYMARDSVSRSAVRGSLEGRDGY